MKEMITWALRLATKLFEFRTSKKEVAKREEKTLDKKVNKTNKAIADGDKDAVNERLKRHTMKVIVFGFFLMILGSACVTKVVYSTADQTAVPMTHEGIEGWFVPNGVMSVLMEKAERYDASLLPE